MSTCDGQREKHFFHKSVITVCARFFIGDLSRVASNLEQFSNYPSQDGAPRLLYDGWNVVSKWSNHEL